MSTAHDMVEMLRRHYLPDPQRPAGIFATEIQAPGSGGRRADLIFQGCVAATGSKLVGHEIKVTRSDLLAELADLTKSHPWQSLCHRWWLVVADQALVDRLDIPESWGIMAPPSGRRTRSMTILRPAPPLHPTNEAAGARAVAAWLHWRHRDQAQRLERAENDAARYERRAREAEARVPRDGARSPLHEIVEKIVNELGGPAGPTWGRSDQIGRGFPPHTVQDVVAALTDVQQLRKDTDRERHQVQDVARSLARALEAVDRAEVRKLIAALDQQRRAS